MGRVFVLGSLNVDSVVRVERHPLPGETLRGGDLATFWGGKGANQAVAAAEAGADVVFIGRVGDDGDGRDYRTRLATRSIDIRPLTVTKGVTTGHAMIAVDAHGENTIIVSPGANARVALSDLTLLRREELAPVTRAPFAEDGEIAAAADIDGDDARSADLAGVPSLRTTDTVYDSEPSPLSEDDVLLVSLELDLDVVRQAIRWASATGARIVLNLAPFAELPADVLALADPVIVNEHEAAELRASGIEPDSLLVTLGPDGSRWGGITVPGSPVADVVDTTGAGDTYCGTLAARLSRGDSAQAAMKAASAAAARSVGWLGAQPA
ncbi:ribokinase [Subtercola sp. PAMC28395]|uniref:PfkB family carbohydrate kinase n=1 Tax=Subtercola sp. PAMC28395 TaxID=2846775 RepID=UPI001C0BEDD3|nr:PfkB family carbohydrate kinase [Subtercola sp. PAMC28395]QWT24577.1 ribokinase [Subtercola sp. PAMC28395]